MRCVVYWLIKTFLFIRRSFLYKQLKMGKCLGYLWVHWQKRCCILGPSIYFAIVVYMVGRIIYIFSICINHSPTKNRKWARSDRICGWGPHRPFIIGIKYLTVVSIAFESFVNFSILFFLIDLTFYQVDRYLHLHMTCIVII